MTFGAVLLDMDGTLLDSEKVWEVALREPLEMPGLCECLET
jgi:beta-phosphoglucomutase-like phosphatase (HAD superfamily)